MSEQGISKACPPRFAWGGLGRAVFEGRRSTRQISLRNGDRGDIVLYLTLIFMFGLSWPYLRENADCGHNRYFIDLAEMIAGAGIHVDDV
jgi:hypothetical protein